VKILGIDPGSYRMGFGLIEKTGNQMSLIHCETIQSHSELLEDRLRELGLRLNALLELHRPQTAVVERVFLGKNPHSVFVLGHARGVALYELAKFKIETFEYSPREIKKNLTGQGQASKECMNQFVREILGIEIATTMEIDASDALSMAIVHGQRIEAVWPGSGRREVNL
jgi:crossover junction endodeoxyribonuclease RuvC